MRVALAQVHVAALDVGANIARTLRAIEEAAASGAELVVLPELVTTGWVMEDPAALRDLAEVADGNGPALVGWSGAAHDLDIAVVGGFLEAHGGQLYNSAVAIDQGGAVRCVYRKLHLFAGERTVLAKGDVGLPVFELAGHRAGILVCYDLRFPEAMRLLALNGAELVIVPTAWVAGFDPEIDYSLPRIGQVDAVLVQANLNQVFVVCADVVGKTGSHDFLGRSMIANPYGKPVAGPASPVDEELVLADIDLAEVQRALHRADGISPRDHRRTDVYELSLRACHKREE